MSLNSTPSSDRTHIGFFGKRNSGKSSLLNAIDNRFQISTAEISEKLGRGRHTTRHSELVPLPNGGYIIDTPGFGSFDITRLEIDECHNLFREFEPYIDGCKFRDCSHTVEKGCRVLEAVHEMAIDEARHESYCKLVQEIRNSQKRK